MYAIAILAQVSDDFWVRQVIIALFVVVTHWKEISVSIIE